MLADDHLMLRQALCVALAAEADITVVGEVGTGAEVFDVLAELKLDVLVLDISLPDINGIDVAKRVTKLHPSLRILALSGHADQYCIEEMLKAGALGYVVKSAGAEELIKAVRAVAKGGGYLSPEAALIMIRRIGNDAKRGAPPPSVLSRRERQVLCMLADGKRAAEIADSLGIVVSTVEAHRAHIKEKLGLHTAVALTRYAIRNGFIIA
jgi:two-component system NarL family response regulator